MKTAFPFDAGPIGPVCEIIIIMRNKHSIGPEIFHELWFNNKREKFNQFISSSLKNRSECPVSNEFLAG